MILSVIIPIFLLLASGYLSVKLSLINKEQMGAVAAFVIRIALPALFLQSLSEKDLDMIWQPELFYIYTLATFIVFAIAFFLTKHHFQNSRTDASILAVGASMSNTGLLGTAILTLIIGQKALSYTSLVVIIESVLLVPTALILARASGQARLSAIQIIGSSLLNLLKNPLFISVVIGILCAVFQIRLPTYLSQVLSLIGQTASPLALMVIGGSVVGLTLKFVNLQSCYLVFSSTFIFPLLVFCGLRYLSQAPLEVVYVGTLIAALPMPTLFGMLGQAYGLNDRAMTPLLMSTIVGFITMPILITLWWG